jgi:LacI family transcriptional regulator
MKDERSHFDMGMALDRLPQARVWRKMGRPQSITIEHVATLAGVSRQTVSRVLNNSPNVKSVVKQRIEAAIEELGYVPNLAARRMGGAKSYLILAVNDRERTIENWQAGRGNDWVDQMLYGGMTASEQRGYHMLFELVDTDPPLATRQLERAVSALRPDGVILTPPHSGNQGLVNLLAARGMACACIGIDTAFDGITVRMDEEAASADATRLLLDHGHVRIAFIAGSSAYASSDSRVRGYRAALAAAGVQSPDSFVEHGEFRFDLAAEAMERLLDLPAPPTAVIASNDEMAFAVLHVASKHGLEVPGDISVISFEDTPGVRFSVPPLTAIRQPTAAIIARATELLIDRAAGTDVAGIFTIPHELVVRGTTGPTGR